MPESNKNITKTVTERHSEEKLLSAGVLRFHKQLIVLTHIIVFAVSLMMAFLLANNMRFESEWFLYQYPRLLLLFIIIKLPTRTSSTPIIESAVQWYPSKIVENAKATSGKISVTYAALSAPIRPIKVR